MSTPSFFAQQQVRLGLIPRAIDGFGEAKRHGLRPFLEDDRADGDRSRPPPGILFSHAKPGYGLNSRSSSRWRCSSWGYDGSDQRQRRQFLRSRRDRGGLRRRGGAGRNDRGRRPARCGKQRPVPGRGQSAERRAQSGFPRAAPDRAWTRPPRGPAPSRPKRGPLWGPAHRRSRPWSSDLRDQRRGRLTLSPSGQRQRPVASATSRVSGARRTAGGGPKARSAFTVARSRSSGHGFAGSTGPSASCRVGKTPSAKTGSANGR